MNETARVTPYKMNPAEDCIVFGDELRDGMQVVVEDEGARCHGREDLQLRMNRFCRVTRVRRINGGETIVFIGEWVDGYQQAFRLHHTFTWIVKRDGAPSAEDEIRDLAEGDPS